MKKEKLNKGHFIEVRDRAYNIGIIVENMLLDHPVILQTPLLKKKTNKILELVYQIYNKIPF